MIAFIRGGRDIVIVSSTPGSAEPLDILSWHVSSEVGPVFIDWSPLLGSRSYVAFQAGGNIWRLDIEHTGDSLQPVSLPAYPEQRLTADRTYAAFPVWSPVRTDSMGNPCLEIAFQAGTSSDLYRMNQDGGNLQSVAASKRPEIHPAWIR
jgi:hypothetical protein